MSKQTEALKLALEALENAQANVGEWWPEAINALREALALVNEVDQEQPAPVAEPRKQEPEPVAWGVDWGKAGDIACVSIIKRLPDGRIEVVAVEYAPYSYTSPPAQRKPLHQEHIFEAYRKALGQYVRSQDEAMVLKFARAIEASHGIKEKNT